MQPCQELTCTLHRSLVTESFGAQESIICTTHTRALAVGINVLLSTCNQHMYCKHLVLWLYYFNTLLLQYIGSTIGKALPILSDILAGAPLAKK